MHHLRNLFILLLILSAGAVHAAPAAGMPSFAFFYSEQAPWDQLQAFDWAVVDPDHVPEGGAPAMAQTRVAAYVSVGEIHPSRSYAALIPAHWRHGMNRIWGSLLIDQAQPAWPAFFADHVIDPLWQRGFRAFFLDTLDAYHLYALTPEERQRQEAGLVAVVREVVRRHPDVRFIYNRGFEILEPTRSHVVAVAAESLYERFDASAGVYERVPAADRAWLLEQLNRVRREFHLPVIAIDYVAPQRRELARATARRIEELGIIPWVTTPDHATMGVGSIEAMPRRVLVVHSPVASERGLRLSDPVRLLTLPLNYLGYVPEFVSADELPPRPLAGRYAGVVVWLEQAPDGTSRQRLLRWLERQVGDGMPLALVNELSFVFGSPLGKTLGLAASPAGRTTAFVTVRQKAALMGLEAAPRPPADGFFPLALAAGQPLLTLQQDDAVQIAAALTPWGGYVMAPYGVVTLPGDSGARWVVDPFAFLREALRLPDMPTPDVTTESGRRMLMIHMDGDGFVNRTDLPGRPLAGELVRDRIVRAYRLPMTISVIEAETSPQGLHPELSARAEQAAREIFSAPHVTIASHSYTHPFDWLRAGSSADSRPGAYHLQVPGYQFNLQREIEGSVRYIEERLAPPGKKVEIFFWSGDCIPGSEALAWTQRLGLLNINGGDTDATHANPSLTRMEGLGLQYRGGFQVFAPNQNENVYTNNWQGPYYGYERAVETFELTERPRRLKPIDVYFHSYITTRRAGLASLEAVLDYAVKQETTPVTVADYARQVLDFQHLALARTPTGWRVRGSGALRTLRLASAAGRPDLLRSTAVAGYRETREGAYVHLAGGSAELVLETGKAPAMPRLESANGRIAAYEAGRGSYRWTLEGKVPLQFTLDRVAGCRVRAGGKDLTPVARQGTRSHYALSAHAARPLEALCQQ